MRLTRSFADLTIDMEVAEDYVKFCTAYVMEHNADDLAFFEKQIEPVAVPRCSDA